MYNLGHAHVVLEIIAMQGTRALVHCSYVSPVSPLPAGFRGGLGEAGVVYVSLGTVCGS